MSKKSKLRAIAFLVFSMLVLISCSTSSPTPITIEGAASTSIAEIEEAASTSTVSISYPEGSLAWMNDNCLYQMGKSGWFFAGYCFQASPLGQEDVYWVFDAKGEIVMVIDVRDPEYTVVEDIVLDVKIAVHNETDERFLLVDGEWISEHDLALAPQTTVVPQSETGETVSGAEALRLLQEAQIRMAGVWAQPSCKYSYNGCR